jgi:hypothetical protein
MYLAGVIKERTEKREDRKCLSSNSPITNRVSIPGALLGERDVTKSRSLQWAARRNFKDS